jgi:general secretion pathway protein I
LSRAIHSAKRGFTLIEVLVAIAILGLGLTAILAAQGGTFTSVSHAKNLSQATGLGRCKMSEVEADLTKNGFTENDINESGACCDHSDAIRMTCSWRVEKPVFPEPKLGELNLDTKLDLGADSGGQGLSQISSATRGKLALPQGGNIGDMAEALAGGGGDIANSAGSMLMGIVYPEVKQVFEAGTRKVTITVNWFEGSRAYTSELVQWVVNGRAAGITSELPSQDLDNQPDPSGSNSPAGGNPFAPKPGRTTK